MMAHTISGYSDPINHALAYAAKHQARQVWTGDRAPYGTAPANVAIILTRYGQDEATVVGAILHDVVSDLLLQGRARDWLETRVGEKFGAGIVDTLLAISERRTDDDGVEMSLEERKEDALERLATADARGRWIRAAAAVHAGSSLLADLRRTEFPDAVWARFPAGRETTLRWYRRLHDRLAELGFDAPIMRELRDVVEALEGESRRLDEAESARG